MEWTVWLSAITLVLLSASFCFGVYIREARGRGVKRYANTLYDKVSNDRHMRITGLFAVGVLIYTVINITGWVNDDYQYVPGFLILVGSGLGYLVRTHLYEDRT